VSNADAEKEEKEDKEEEKKDFFDDGL